MNLKNNLNKAVMVKEINGYKYSKKPFEGYTHRAKFIIVDAKREQLINTDIYTTNTDRNIVELHFLGQVFSKKNTNELLLEECGVKHWTTKEKDDLDSKFIDEILKGI
jgi:hypothetical protein